MLLRCATTIAATLATAAVAHADDDELGTFEQAGFVVGLGGASMTTLGDHVYMDDGGSYGGGVMQVRMEGLSIARLTQHGAQGFYMRGDVYAFTPGVIVRDDRTFDSTPTGPRLLGLMSAELGAALLLDAYRTRNRQLSVAPELFIGTDRTGAGIGAMLRLYRLRLHYTLRAGKTWGDASVREEELRASWTRRPHDDDSGKPRSTELGFIMTHGYAEDERGLADLRAMNKGGYTQFMLYLGYKWSRL